MLMPRNHAAAAESLKQWKAFRMNNASNNLNNDNNAVADEQRRRTESVEVYYHSDTKITMTVSYRGR